MRSIFLIWTDFSALFCNKIQRWESTVYNIISLLQKYNSITYISITPPSHLNHTKEK
ncbi:hypothetical protein Lalb_Chr17g0343791 [Lupinus albus]|uniref:Uncharacterized protein n=1 Tax=Lupinus albus TaxID=3870 RepID=A0A6A4P684_LUPAL|nr:hypothetical protein Lalb_Chr17g0343791 [Lupinus albus]